MDITNAQYVNDSYTGDLDHIKATINGRVCSVPISDGNMDYVEIMRQVEAGTLTIADAD